VTLDVVHCSVVPAFDVVGDSLLLVFVRTNIPCLVHRGNCLGYRRRHDTKPVYE